MTEHLDVVIVGAGLSGVGAAAQLHASHPGKTFAVLEAREAIGGTWDLFRYPGIRSDSDMFTLGYRFRPWEEAQAIADGPSILRYVNDTADASGVRDAIRLGHKVTRASWDSATARWTVEAEHDGGTVALTCSFLQLCTGYYRYDQGYTPELPGIESFAGQVVHPQHWPADLDHTGKRVVVIGSGATAVTLVPAMADRAAHITMLQRTPTYIVTLPGRDPLAALLLRVLPPRVVYPLVRWKNVLMMQGSFHISRRWPGVMKKFIRAGQKRHLPESFDFRRHLNPPYEPWDQRLCLVPDADLFDVIADGRASIVTDRIETFTEGGIRLASGDELEADLVITATGLNLLAAGGTELVVDGEPVEIADHVGYKGMMFSGIPNLAMTVGYTNASWTLKADLVAEYVSRLLEHMDRHGYDVAMPVEPPPDVQRVPFIDLTAGYVQRSLHLFPKQGDRTPWRLHQNYLKDVLLIRRGPVDDEGIEFSRAPAPDSGEPRVLHSSTPV